ncbi:MAG: sugar phosphate isomerase/epimerase, partial [Oscillospiraceae bacterium]|nr:sugar phosphate isomerase/epimerase [Oscillospiraceae bacterium]
MKLGFASAILPDLSFEEVYDFAAENGFKCVETMCWPKGKAERRYAGVTHIDVATLTDKQAEEYRAYADEKGVEISAISYYPNPLDSDLEARNTYIEHIKACIVAAKKLGIRNMNTFIGRDYQKSVSENMAEFKKVWPDIIKFAEEQDIRIGIENCPMLFSNDEWPGGKNLAISPKIWREMFAEIDSDHFGLNIDPSHMYWMQMDYIK